MDRPLVRYRIFVSHAATDGELVRTIRAHAEAIGVETYFYDRDSQAGRPLRDKLKDAIQGSDALLAVLSDSASQSPYVNQEIGVAIGLGKPVLPLVAPAGGRPALAMLEGDEYIAFDPAAPEKGTAALVRSLHVRQQAKLNEQLVLVLVVVALVVLLFWSARLERIT